MPKSRSRGKANSNYSRDHKMFSTCQLFTWEGLLNANDGEQYTTAQTYLRMGGWCPMGEYLADQLIKRPRNWMIGVRALCRAPDGTEWMESQMFDLPSRRITDISGAYHELRQDVMSAQPCSQVYDLGWIAQTWAGRKPEDDNELWHHYYAPPGIIRQVCRDDAVISRMAGPVYSESRQATWQLSNKDYLEQRARELAA
jgi:hypothetical protein